MQYGKIPTNQMMTLNSFFRMNLSIQGINGAMIFLPFSASCKISNSLFYRVYVGDEQSMTNSARRIGFSLYLSGDRVPIYPLVKKSLLRNSLRLNFGAKAKRARNTHKAHRIKAMHIYVRLAQFQIWHSRFNSNIVLQEALNE